MPVYNAQAYLRLAIESVLAQSEPNFEFIIIDDGSTDSTRDIVRGFNDERIKLICNEENKGLPRTLNIGLALAQGEYIARMDGDDICATERFKNQLTFMRENPDLAASGTWAIDIDENGSVLGEHRAWVGQKLNIYRLLPSPMIHPTVIMRRDIVQDLGYGDDVKHGEDYDLWLRIQKQHRIDNLPQFLFKYRVHPASQTSLEGDLQFQNSHRLFSRHVFEVSFEVFAAMMFRNYAISPAVRWRAMVRLARHSRVAPRKYWQNQTMYTLKWGACIARKLTRRPG